MATLSKEGLSVSRHMELETNQAMRAGVGKRVSWGLTYAPQPDDADGALREAVATHPQGLP